MTEDLDTARAALDTIDKRIVEALAERDRIVADVAALKTDDDKPVRDIDREEALLGRIVAHAESAGLSADYATRLFRDILDHSLRRQHHLLTEPEPSEAPLVVAFQGTEGSYSHSAAARHFTAVGRPVDLRGHHTFKQAFEAVHSGVAEYGVLPVENTTAGSINETYDLLARHDLSIVGEEVLHIDHCLLAVEPVPLSRIRRIYSQAQALWQCTEFLDQLEHCSAVSFTDTAMSCQKIVEEQDLAQAAIASADAARLYGLHVLKRGVANQKENYTRFAVITHDAVPQDLRIPCKTSLMFSTKHQKGALLEGMAVLATYELNLTKLESRPRPGVPWEYLFYVDFEGNVADERVQSALHELKKHTSFLKVLGSYPARTTAASRAAEPKQASAQVPSVAPAPRNDTDLIRELEQKPYRLASRATQATDSVVRIGAALVPGDKALMLARLPGSMTDEVMTEVAKAGFVGAIVSLAPGRGELSVAEVKAMAKARGLSFLVELQRAADVALAHAADGVVIAGVQMDDFALLEAVGKIDRPVILGRGPMASIDEWLAAAECVLEHGNQQVVLCDAGVRTFETATLRTLDMASIGALRSRTHLPVIVEPTATGLDEPWVSALGDAALTCGAQGLVVSVSVDSEVTTWARVAQRGVG